MRGNNKITIKIVTNMHTSETKTGQVDNRFYQQKAGMAMESSLSLVVSNIYMEHFGKLALETEQHKPSLWFRYVDDTLVIWPHGADGLQNFLTHLNNLRSSIQFTMEIQSEGGIPFLDVLVIRKGTALSTKVYKKTHPHWPIS
jgi:hypothetical protein